MSRTRIFIVACIWSGLAAFPALAQETLSSVQREMDRVEKEIEREKELHKTEQKRLADFENEKAAKLKALQDQIKLTQDRSDSLKGQLGRARGQKAGFKSQAALFQNKEKEFAKALIQAIRGQAAALGKDFPYQLQKRVSDLEELANAVETGVVTVEDGMGRFFSLLQSSLEFAQDTEVYRGSYTATDGAVLEGSYVRMGAVLLAFASEDGQRAAWLAKTESGYAWMDKDLPQQVKQDIFTAVSVAQGKVAPQLVRLPFSAPVAKAAGETSGESAKGGAR